MPLRLIREAILTSERVDQLDPPAEVFYRRLMSKVDDYGLFDARPSILRASLYPLRIDRVREADCSRWIAACEKAGLIALYQHDGRPYMQMLDTRWQTRSEPKHPLPPWGKGDPVKATDNSCSQSLSPAHLDVFGVEDEEEHAPLTGGGPVEPVGFKAFWEAWPRSKRKEARGKCLDAWKRGKLEASARVILAHVEGWKASEEWQKQNGQFIPAPLVYLNGRRWDGAESEAPAAKAAFEGAV